jgi:DNA-directed RNA polymerase III subunit RPC8
MFVLSIIEDKLKINPHEFDKDTADVLLRRINGKYVNKVIPDVGLCIAFYDFIDVGVPYIYPGEGASHQHVKFRMVVFRPFVAEIMTGKVINCSQDGIKVSLDFFDDVYIPSYSLQVPSEYSDRQWRWEYTEGEAFVTEIGDTIRFKVVAIDFSKVVTTARGVNTTTTSTEEQGSASGQQGKMDPLHKPLGGGSAAADSAAVSSLFPEENPPLLRKRSRSIDLAMSDELPPAMKIIGSANEDGLGLVTWWVV